MLSKPRNSVTRLSMSNKQPLGEEELAAIAKQFRGQAGKTRAQAAREMGVSVVSIFRAEEKATESLLKLRMRMIEVYSPYRVAGPVFFLEKK